MMRPLPALLLAASTFFSFSIGSVASADLEFEVIAMLKDDSIDDPEADILPGMADADWRPREFSRASIGDGGVMVFRAEDSSFEEGIWAGLPGDLHLIARVGPAIPGGGGTVFDAVRDPSFDAGFVSFLGSSSDQTPGYGEIWSGPVGEIPERLVSTGEDAPGGGIFERFYPPSALADGSVVFVGESDAPAGAGSDYGIYIHQASPINEVKALAAGELANSRISVGRHDLWQHSAHLASTWRHRVRIWWDTLPGAGPHDARSSRGHHGAPTKPWHGRGDLVALLLHAQCRFRSDFLGKG